MKAILFDADGVLALPEEAFSVVYTRSHGLDIAPINSFFETEWRDFVVGKRDLKEHIADTPELWKWHGTPDELLDFWFRTEDVQNHELLDIIQQLRAQNVPCYVATEQEKYRTEYMQNVMFPDKFDGFFSTAELGFRKTDPKFFETILDKLQLAPSDVTFFDDSESKIRTAASIGIDARLYTHAQQVRALIDS